MPSVAETLQNILFQRDAQKRQAFIDQQNLAHQQEAERLAREQEQRASELQNENMKIAEQNRIKGALDATGIGGSVDEATASAAQKAGLGGMLKNAAPAVTDTVAPEMNPAKQQGIFPGIIASSAPSISNSGAAPGMLARGTAAERATAEKEANIRKAGELLHGVTDRREATEKLLAAGIPSADTDNLVTAFIGPKDVVKAPTAEEDKAKAIDIGTRLAMGAPVTPQEKEWANQYRKVSTQGVTTSFAINTPVRETARSDRSYAALSTQIESGYKPVADQLDRMGRLSVSVGQETPQADALIAPELLTAMAGGMGSGLRMNESEIARIVGGRSAFENLKAILMHYNPDNKQALSITPEQRVQIRSLVTEMQAKLLAKQEAYAQARQDLASADTVDEQRKIANDLKSTVAKIDNPPHTTTPAAAAAVPGAVRPKSSGIKSITEMK